jgi:uncharacterized phage protein (TIGR01671 family)
MAQAETKFRAWDDGVMVYSHNNSENTEYFQLSWFFGKIREDAITMQYLGKKDKNEKEICEGDLIRQGDTLFEVKKCDGGYELQIWREMKKGGAIEGSVYNISALSERYCEIIGNIYENPKILN